MKRVVVDDASASPLRETIPEIEEIEVFMPAYLLLLVAVLSRLLPHAGWMNFTAVGGAMLYFGARRSWREMVAPLAVLMAVGATEKGLPVWTAKVRLSDHPSTAELSKPF